MEAKLQKQQILSESIRKILSNFKKDSAKRKTAAYISERLEVVEELWTQFDLNNTILSTSTERKTDDYFINKAYEKVKQEYETIRGLLQNWQVSSTEDKGIPSNTDELINQQSTNFRAFMRIIKNINISDIKEKWEIEDKLEMLQARWKIIDKLHWQIDNLLVGTNVFRNMTSGIKLKTLKQLQICTNCMFSHNGQECTSNKTCKICNDRHHTILHEVIDTEISRSETNSATTANKQPTTSDSLPRNVNHVAGTHSEVLLATVQLKIMAVDGTYLIMRCLLDQGSQISLITESAAQRLGLPRRKQQASVLGVGISSNKSHGTMQLVCESLYSDYRLTIEALVMKKVLNSLPNYSFEQQNWPHLRNITLADPDYNISRPIDILLDASVYAEIVQDGILRGPPHAPIAQQTQMGGAHLSRPTNPDAARWRVQLTQMGEQYARIA
ncbi:unnamed protein product [Arctia plantaginis]|uniref:Peptidase aspartic putative domain-containing protein n=1 Tax=Arctia plantaginis TaxID=874455 RepID=A0A8S1B4G5_ARCPL|nr:unnamed protein product [Arctia plantaginis]